MHSPIRSSGLTFIFFAVFFFCFSSQSLASSDVIFPQRLLHNIFPDETEWLVEYPDYGVTDSGDYRDEKAIAVDHLIYDKAECGPTNFPFEKRMDVNRHPYFPKLQQSAIHGDHLGGFFYKEKNSGNFILKHWAEESLPIVFHMTEPMGVYKNWIREVVDNINVTAQRNGLIRADQRLIVLSHDIVDPKEESCTKHLIFQAGHDGFALMRAYITTIDDNEERLGEIVDADIVIYEEAEKRYRGKNLKRGFQHDLTHEFLHTLGLDHNFALGSVMSYDDSMLDLTELQDDISAYEIDALRYVLFGKASTTPWALVRSTKGIEVDEKYIPEGRYLVNLSEPQAICKNLATAEEEIVPLLSMSMDLKYVIKEYSKKVEMRFQSSSGNTEKFPGFFSSDFEIYGKLPIDGNIDAKFVSDSPKFQFGDAFPTSLNNRFSAHIDTGFTTLQSDVNPDHLNAKWNILDHNGAPIEECSISSSFELSSQPMIIGENFYDKTTIENLPTDKH